MQIKEINQIMLARRNVLTGTFQRYKVENHPKAGVYEQFGVLVGDQVHSFTVFAAKGTHLDKVPKPAFADKPGALVAVLDASVKLDGKYLRTGASAVVSLEG